MTERMIENRIKKLQEIEVKQKELEAQAEALKAEIKEEMQSRGISELNTPNYIVRLTEMLVNRFDSKTFKEKYKTLYEAYMKPQKVIRFTIV